MLELLPMSPWTLNLAFFVFRPSHSEMHTKTTAHNDGRIVKSPASGFSTNLAGVNADVHIVFGPLSKQMRLLHL